LRKFILGQDPLLASVTEPHLSYGTMAPDKNIVAAMAAAVAAPALTLVLEFYKIYILQLQTI
jgi:hypothetical protein